MLAPTLDQVTAALTSAAIPFSGCAVLPLGMVAQPGWFVVSHPSGQLVRVDGTLTSGQQATATTTIQALDGAAGALAAAKAAKLAALAAWKSAKFASGVVVTDSTVSPSVSYTWAAAEVAGQGQDLLHKQWSATKNALDAQALTPDSALTVYDVGQNPPAAASLTVAKFQALLLQYDQAVQQAYFTFLEKSSEVAAAQTQAALDAITLPA